MEINLSKELHTRVTLLEKIRQHNDNRSWEEYERYYKGYIFALLKNMGFNHQDCQDLLQQVLLKAWKTLPDFEYEKSRGKFRSWLTIVTRNTARDYIKSRAGKNRQREIELDPELQAINTISEPEIYLIADKEWKIYISKMAWDGIKDDFKESLLESFMRASSGESIKEIAADLNIAESSVSVYKKRIQKALMKEIIRLEDYLS